MKPKQTNLSKYMNLTKKAKSIKKAKYKTVIPNIMDSNSNKYSNYLQSSLKEVDIFLIKRKLKGYSKIHSHSMSNTNKIIDNKYNNKMPLSSYINYMSPENTYLLKKQKDNIFVDKSSKKHLMLTSMNNSSIIQSSKEKIFAHSINNISNYQSNQNNVNNFLCNNAKCVSFKGINGNSNFTNNSIQKKIYNESGNKMEINIIKKAKKDKKYSLTSINSRKNSIDKEDPEVVKKLNKVNFNGLFKNTNNNKITYSSKNSAKNITSVNNNNNINNNNNNNNSNNKKLCLGEYFNLKKKKFANYFLEIYSKAPETSNNNRKIKTNLNNTNNNLNNHTKTNSNINNNNSNNNNNNNNNNNQNQISNNTISPNNKIGSSNYSPVNNNKFFKTAKVSPRITFPKKKQELQSHRINIKNKISGNILAFYNNYKKNNLNSANNYLLYGNSYNLDNTSNYTNNKSIIQLNKKSKKNNMSMNMNMSPNNLSIIKKRKSESNQMITNNNFPKCSSLNKIKNNNNNFITNYNGNGNNNNVHNTSNNSFIKKKIINPIMNNSKKYNNNNDNQINNNIINNCQININNINYNNYNQNCVNKNNLLMNEKIMNLFKKKNIIDMSSNKLSKIFSQSQQDIAQNKKTENNNVTSNNSPINKSSICIKLINRGLNNNNNNSSTSNINNKNTSNNSINTNNKEIQKPKIKSKEFKDKDNHINKNTINENISIIKKKLMKNEEKKNEILDTNNNNQKDIKYNNPNEIQELKHNLKKTKSEKNFDQKNSKNKENDQENNNNTNNTNNNVVVENKNINTISCVSTTTRDSYYYMEKCNSLSKYIKDYYKKNKNYPSTDLNFYLYGRLIGQGAFAKVNIGLNVLTGRVVAIKSFNKKDLNKNGDNMRKILYETNLMKKLNHPNVTKILEMFEDEEYILIAMEYINGGNLFSFVKKRREISEKKAKFLFRQIILGIKHIHSHKIVHRDIKLENILIDLNNNIKICDFGIGRILSSKRQLLHDKCGTPMYMAPEILLSTNNQGYEGFPVDIWSSGISLYIMLSGTLPFNLKNNDSSSFDESNDNNAELQYSIINKEPKHIEKISDEARDLLKGLLNKNPKKRLTIDQILNHPWLKNDDTKSNKKMHLFTKAEMIMLSKTYIDYRNGVIEDLKENFTISNLKNDSNQAGEKKLKNISTKSTLLAPYNTLIQDDESLSESELKDSFDDLNNTKIDLENDIIVINNKVKEYNLNYELNNNVECDNGMLINSKIGTQSSNVNNSNHNNESQLSSGSRKKNNDDDNDILDELNENENEDKEEEQEKKINKILDEIEKIGYDREYVINCVQNNVLCHASAVYYLMSNYKDI